MANQFLTLSMFIMLLSFFIILNALASFDDDKSKPVVKSLALAFSTKEIVDDALANSTVESAAEQESFKEGSTIDKIQGLFENQISGIEMRKNRFGTEMYIRIPINDFKDALMEPISNQKTRSGVPRVGNVLVPVLISLLQGNEDAEAAYQMDMLMGVDGNPARLMNEALQDMNDVIKQSAVFAQRLEESGLPKEYITAGIRKGQPGFVDLHFRPYQPFNPLQGAAR
jgi:hypothetical protein